MYQPTEITVAGIPYTIEYKAINDWGRVDTDKKLITISTKIKTTEGIVETLLHEATHVVLRTSGLFYSLLKSDMHKEEGIVRAIENLLFPVIKKVLKDSIEK